MTLEPARPAKKKTGVLGEGEAPPVGLGFGIPPAAQVRVRPHYLDLPGPLPRREMGWVCRNTGDVGKFVFQYFQDTTQV